MAQDKVDELVIELTARDKATEKIDNLAKSLKGLSDSLSSSKFNNVSNSMKSMSGAIQELGRSTRAINNIPKLTSELSNMMNTLSQAPAISKEVLSLAHALSKIDGSTIKGFSGASTPKVNTESTVQEMQAVESEEKKVDSQTKEVTKSFSNLGSSAKHAFKGIGSILPSINLSQVGKTVGGISKKIWELYKNVSLLHKINNMGLKKGFTTLLRYTVGIRSLFVLANKIRSAIEDGNKNLSKYSAEFNNSMSLYKSGLGTLKNAMSVAFAPLVNYFSEAVNKILDSFIDAFNTIARLMATLTGAKQVVQATRYYEDYADSLDKSSKSAKALTTGIDELNVLNDSSSSSGSSSTDVEDMFETIEVDSEFSSLAESLKTAWENADFFDIGKDIGDKINTALQNIDWETIKSNAGKLGKSLATFLNGVLSSEINDQSIGYTVGSTIAEAINTGLTFANSFAYNFDWALLGKNIADSIDGFFKTWDAGLTAETLGNFANGFITACTSAIKRVMDNNTFETIGIKFAEFLSNIPWVETWFNVGEFFATLGKALIDFPADFVSGFWKGLLKAIFDPSGINEDIQKSIDEYVASIDFAGYFRKAFSTIPVFDQLFKISDFVKALPTLSEIGKAIKDLFTSDSSGTTSLKEVGGYILEGIKIGFKNKISSFVDPIKDFFDSAIKFIKDVFDINSPAKSMYEYGGYIFEGIVEGFKEKFAEWGTAVQTWYDNDVRPWFTRERWITLGEEVRSALETKWSAIKQNASTTFQNIKDDIATKWTNIKNDTSTKWSDIKTNLSTTWTNLKTDGFTKFTAIKTTIGTKWDEIKTNTSTKWSSIKTELSTKWGDIKSDAREKFNQMKTNTIASFTGIKNGIVYPINCIIEFVESMVNKVVDGFNSVADAIQDLTSFSWENPVTGTVYSSSGINLPRAEHISIPRLADGGFVPNTGMGSLFWAGENGAEIVANANGGTEVLNATQVASAVTSGVTQAIVDNLIPYMTSLVDSNNAIADKDLSVNIGDREIAEANRRGESSLGLQLITI